MISNMFWALCASSGRVGYINLLGIAKEAVCAWGGGFLIKHIDPSNLPRVTPTPNHAVYVNVCELCMEITNQMGYT
jgi:hypothetical protein